MNRKRTKFQFHKGTIKTSTFKLSVLCRFSFNSIKVRLKPAGLNPSVVYGSEFQFHKGTIKTDIKAIATGNLSAFQFHKGTIKTDNAHLDYTHAQNSFNSIKVRLKQRVICLEKIMNLTFQFHKGTIKTLLVR